MTLPKHVQAVLPGRYQAHSVGLPAKGGQGAVYRVHDTFLARDVALKVATTLDKTSFERELDALQNVRSKYVVDVYDAIRDPDDGELVAIVLEYLPGPDVEDACPTGSCYAVPDLLRLMWQTTSGLAAIHGAGHVHHDFKPKNVRFDAAGIPKVCDFGMTRHDQSQTVHGFGTPGYLAPELFHAPRQITPAIDIWAVGATAFRLATGNVPQELWSMPPTATPPPIESVRSDLPSIVADAINLCLNFAPHLRPQCHELVAIFAKALMRDKHRALLCHGQNYWVVDGNTRNCALAVGAAQFTVSYDGFDFWLTITSGTARVNNDPVSGPTRLPEACVISVNGDAAHISFAVSHPENVL